MIPFSEWFCFWVLSLTSSPMQAWFSNLQIRKCYQVPPSSLVKYTFFGRPLKDQSTVESFLTKLKPNSDKSQQHCARVMKKESQVSKVIQLFHCVATAAPINVDFQLPPSPEHGKPSSFCRIHTDEVTISPEPSSVLMVLLGRQNTSFLCKFLPTVVTVWPIFFQKIEPGPV